MHFLARVEAQDIGVVGFIVTIKVNRGNRVGLVGIGFQVAIMMIIAYKHHGIIINGVTTRTNPLK